MPSFTSNSESIAARRGIKILLLSVCAVLLCLELGARYLVPMINWNMRRFHKECGDAVTIGVKPGLPSPDILLLGNSLTLADINVDLLAGALGQEHGVARWAIDDTNFLDWYYGLQRAFRS